MASQAQTQRSLIPLIISTEEEIQQDIKAFTQRWGGVDMLTFAHVLQHAHGTDQIIAASALGHTFSTWAKELLLPFLHDDNPKLRWTVALSLGEMQEKQALPMLVTMLQEYLPPPPSSFAEYDWFEIKHIYIANILGRWGETSTIPALRATLERVWQLEQTTTNTRPELWWRYQEALTYALGQLGNIAPLASMNLPTSRYRYWTILIAMGYLNAEYHYQNTATRILQDMHYDGKYPELRKQLLSVLQGNMKHSPQEAELFLASFNDDHAEVWYRQ